MSKLERLNARVAKLLTAAVHEVLEVVKETVSEYQDKTARTQRENESLKRRLLELQDRLKIESAAATLVSQPVSGGRAAVETPQSEPTWSPSSRLKDQEPTLTDTQSDLSQEHHLTLTQDDYKEVDMDLTDCECTFRLMEAAEETLEQTEGGAAYLTAHALNRDMDTDSIRPSASPGTQPASTLQLKPKPGLNLTIIKTEPEPDECRTVTEPPAGPVSDNCVDLSCNSTRHDAAMKCQENAGPDGLLLLYQNQNSVSRRFGFAKNRAALDVMRNRQHFRRDELHVCFVCGKTFSRVGNLRIHQRCHTGEKPYGCLQCGRSFRQAGDLKKHKRVHTGEKPYYCHQCGKSFSRGENLKRHQKIHIGESLQLQQVWRDHQSS